MTNIEIGFSPKTVALEDGTNLHFWYANNAGRSGDNCTIIRSGSPRAEKSANQENVIARTRTSSWKGQVNFSKEAQKALGIITSTDKQGAKL
jgi:hypothetical protein